MTDTLTRFPTRVVEGIGRKDCDYCMMLDRGRVPALFDAPTIAGPWAYLCGKCYRSHANDNAADLGCRIV